MLIAMKALRIVVVGLVQGVGFRPFVYRVAARSGVRGFVRNVGGSEVEIWIEGDDDSVDRFFQLFARELPPPAVIEEIAVYRAEPRGYSGFRIERSSRSILARSAIPPDLSVCDECLKEVLDPRDRRFRYPFNSCAWCGPRYSMMYSVPYDRENTSMRVFPLCSECLAEYTDPNNVRRFHAQGISCPRCGPRLRLVTPSGEVIECRDPIEEAAKLINEGHIVAVKGVGGYHIACLASDDDVVRRLRERKRRPTKPFAVMALSTDVVERLVYLEPPSARALLESPQRPIVLLPKREDSPLAPSVSPGMAFEGVFLPYTPLHYLLLSSVRDRFAVMTSGNVHGEPMCRDLDCVRRVLSRVVDYVLDHDREIVHRVDDSVIRFTDGEPVLLRRGRGYAPMWLRIPVKLEREAVAMGAQLQTAGGVGFEDRAVLTPFIGDLDSPRALDDLWREVMFLAEAYRVDLSKAVVVVDKHPAYASRSLGIELCRERGCRVLEVQHHYAHIVATAMDRGLDLEDWTVGVAIDGVGYGDDGAIWGGEILLVRGGEYRRVARLEYVPYTSDRDAVYPARFAVLMLSKALGPDRALETAQSLGLDRLVPGGMQELEVCIKASRRAVPTSSTGRVLDAISAILGVCSHRTYEGEPAITLENRALRGREIEEAPRVPTRAADDGVEEIETTRLLRWVIEALEQGYDIESIAYTALLRLGEALGYAACRASPRGTPNTVLLGGGAAVNTVIVRGVRRALAERGSRALLPRRVPPNDGGIALGQIGAAAYIVRTELLD